MCEGFAFLFVFIKEILEKREFFTRKSILKEFVEKRLILLFGTTISLDNLIRNCKCGARMKENIYMKDEVWELE